MPINMQGSWTVSVKSKSASFPQRFIISGATSGNGTYVGDVATAPVPVAGAAWAITIQNNPGTGFINSADQIKFPTVSGGQYRFDIESNDAGGDLDFNDLILTCSTPQTATDFLIYGNVSSYSGFCRFNPCWLYWLVIDTPIGLLEALKNPLLRVPIEKLYPDRLRVPPPIPPGPLPDPPPFRPLVIPLRDQTALPPKRAQAFKVLSSQSATTLDSKAKRPDQPTESVVALNSFEVSRSEKLNFDFDRLGLAGLLDGIKLRCVTESMPGVVLRFQEYDRTSAELLGGAYTGDGTRETLGVCATDRNGNYIFRFSRTIGDIVAEALGDVAAGENVVVQALPDIIIQVLDPMAPTGVCYESAPYWNVLLRQRIDLCVPQGCGGRPPTACQGGRAIQAIGNIFVIDPNNKIGTTGRVTAKSSLPATPQARCAAWAGSLDMFACFVDHPEVVYYTIRFRRFGDPDWTFFQEKYKHLEVAKLGIPGYTGSLVGPDPAIPALQIDGGPAVLSPAYHNIESDGAWVLTHRDRKAVISSWVYAPTPGSVRFRIEGYTAAGARVAAATDTITFFIDNSTPDFHIDSVSVLGEPGSDCALFTLPLDNLDAPFTVRFKANQFQGFMKSYQVSVRKGNIGNFAINGTGPGLISQTYVHGDDLLCNELVGTLDDPTVDGSGYVIANLVPAAGDWLAVDQPFCTFAVQLGCSTRVTNGYNTAEAGYGPEEYLLGLQKALP